MACAMGCCWGCPLATSTPTPAGAERLLATLRGLLGEETFLNLEEPGIFEADLTSDVTLQTVRLGINYKF